MKELPRICLMCKYFDFSYGWGGTDVTPGEPMEIGCIKGYWNNAHMYEDADWLRKEMARAANCREYQPSAEALDMFNSTREIETRVCWSCGATTLRGIPCEYCGRPEGENNKKPKNTDCSEIEIDWDKVTFPKGEMLTIVAVPDKQLTPSARAAKLLVEGRAAAVLGGDYEYEVTANNALVRLQFRGGSNYKVLVWGVDSANCEQAEGVDPHIKKGVETLERMS